MNLRLTFIIFAKKLLLVDGGPINENLKLSSQNLHHVNVTPSMATPTLYILLFIICCNRIFQVPSFLNCIVYFGRIIVIPNRAALGSCRRRYTLQELGIICFSIYSPVHLPPASPPFVHALSMTLICRI